MTSAWRYAGLLAFALAWSGSAASAQDNPACAGIEAPLAYNACLAKHGGMVRATSAAGSPVTVTCFNRLFAPAVRRGATAVAPAVAGPPRPAQP